MSNAGRFKDYVPTLTTAGKITTVQDESSANCIKPPANRNQTPPHLKKYRKSHMQQVGSTIVHFGKYDDHLPQQKYVYGLEPKHSDHMTDCIQNKNNEGYSKVINQINEEIYASTVREPLGRRMDRNYVFPEKCNTGDFHFGHPVIPSENTVKDLLQTGFTLNEDPDVKKLYLKSHGNFQPAEQKHRDYNWPFEVNGHVFGKADKMVRNEAQRCLQPEKLDAESFPKTNLVKKNVEDFRDFHKDSLGRPRNLGQTDKLVSSETLIRGRKNCRMV